MMWSWVLSVIGLTAVFFIGQRKWWAWGIAFTNECLWIAYALVTRQYGFILGAVGYASLNLHNGRKWRRLTNT